MTFKQSWAKRYAWFNVEKKIKTTTRTTSVHTSHPIIQRKHFQVLIGWHRTQKTTLTTSTTKKDDYLLKHHSWFYLMWLDQEWLAILISVSIWTKRILSHCVSVCDLVWNAKAVKPNTGGIYKIKIEFCLNSHPFVLVISVVGPIIRWFWRPFYAGSCCVYAWFTPKRKLKL